MIVLKIKRIHDLTPDVTLTSLLYIKLAKCTRVLMRAPPPTLSSHSVLVTH